MNALLLKHYFLRTYARRIVTVPLTVPDCVPFHIGSYFKGTLEINSILPLVILC